MKLRVINSAIKGYHIYHVRPHRGISMVVRKEHTNSYDENAMIVEIPKKEDLPVSFLEEISRPAKGTKNCVKVKDITGKLVGRVPANLGRMFQTLDKNIVKITW